jgi:hypothetical protein
MNKLMVHCLLLATLLKAFEIMFPIHRAIYINLLIYLISSHLMRSPMQCNANHYPTMPHPVVHGIL